MLTKNETTLFRIKHHSEECSCTECGSPHYVGDVVIYDEYDLPFCSERCFHNYYDERST